MDTKPTELEKLSILLINLKWLKKTLEEMVTHSNDRHTMAKITLVDDAYYTWHNDYVDGCDYRIWEVSEYIIDKDGCYCQVIPIDYDCITGALIESIYVDHPFTEMVSKFKNFDFNKHRDAIKKEEDNESNTKTN